VHQHARAARARQSADMVTAKIVALLPDTLLGPPRQGEGALQEARGPISYSPTCALCILPCLCGRMLVCVVDAGADAAGVVGGVVVLWCWGVVDHCVSYRRM
jgi:hypothetical protein